MGSRPPPQAGAFQPPKEFARANRLRAQLDGALPEMARHVVVIPLKRSAVHAQTRRERVQLVVIGVAHQMGPAPAAPRPEGLIHEDGHPDLQKVGHGHGVVMA